MPTDAERFQFIAKFRLHVSFHSDHVTLMWQEKVQHWEASPPYYPVASGPTLEDATDAAIARYNRKHGTLGIGHIDAEIDQTKIMPAVSGVKAPETMLITKAEVPGHPNVSDFSGQ
jgi:hypothetical protein